MHQKLRLVKRPFRTRSRQCDEFMSDCTIDELKAKVKENKEMIKDNKKQHDEEINDLKQLLLMLLPSDKKHMVQDHFDKRAKYVRTVKSTKNKDFSSRNENRIIQDYMNKNHVSYLFKNCIFLFLKQCKVSKASLTLMGTKEGTFHPYHIFSTH